MSDDKDGVDFGKLIKDGTVTNKTTLGVVVAIDTNGKEFPKEVTVFRKYTGGVAHTILSFGYPCEYRLEDLMKGGAIGQRLCIDAAGLNHARAQVFIEADDFDRCKRAAREVLNGSVTVLGLFRALEENIELKRHLRCIVSSGHNDDCLFCGFKDKEAGIALSRFE